MKLDLLSITKSYNGRTQALRDFSLSSEQGAFISVVGTSGSGKTTLFRILNGSLVPDSGRVLLDGTDLTSLKGKKRRLLQRFIGTIYQDFCLVEQTTCLDNVLNACLPDLNPISGSLGLFSKEQKHEARELLRRVGLEDKPDELVKNLSGGQKQRVAIARALMQHPHLLLADEPVASLDPITGRQIMTLLRDICDREGITILMNSHNPELSREFSDRILGLRDGRLVFDGTADELSAELLREIYTGDTEASYE